MAVRLQQNRFVMRFVFGLILFGLLLGLASPAHADTPASLDDYRQAIAQALSLAQQANALPSAERAPLLKNAADTLDTIRAVQLAPNSTVTVNNSELIVLIRDASKTDSAIARLTALGDAMAQAPASINPNDLAVLQDILNHPPFVAATGDNWIQALLRAIMEWLDRLFSNTAQGVFDARDFLILAAVIVVVVVLLYFLRNLRRNLVPEEILPPALTEHDARTPTEAFDNAQRFINAGDFRSAVRQLYLATLLMLDQRGRIKYDPTLTNREYLRQAARDPRAASALQPIIETFDRTWYGFEPISRQDFDAYRHRVEQVRDL